LAKKDLDKAVLKAMDGALTYVIKKGELIHEKTVKARNELICKIMH
jgi:HD superfamily phosphohydrolase YqeK